MKKTITTKNAPSAVGAYSQAIAVNNMLFISGQLPINPGTGELCTGTIELQTRRSLENIKAILEKAGMSLNHVVKTTILLDRMADFTEVNEIYKSFFQENYPARSCFEVAALPMGAGIEIEAIAVKG